MANCTISGTWDAIKTAPYLSKEQWRAFNLLILCELIGGTPFMGACTVDGLWNQVKGNPPYMSEQEFMSENINLLCQLVQGGGGGGGSTNPVYTGAAPPAAPAFPLQGAIFTPDADGVPLQKWIPGTGWVVI